GEGSVVRYLLWGWLVVVIAYLLATWGVMVTMPASSSAGITAVAGAVTVGLGSVAGKITAIVLALFFLFITVVYNYSFARLIFVSGLDSGCPRPCRTGTRPARRTPPCGCRPSSRPCSRCWPSC